jgi:hypothetical protein
VGGASGLACKFMKRNEIRLEEADAMLQVRLFHRRANIPEQPVTHPDMELGASAHVSKRK